MKTRWNSFADALDRYVTIHADLCKYAVSEEAALVRATVVQENILGDQMLANIKAIQPILGFVREATTLMEVEDTPTGVAAVLFLNHLYTTVAAYTSPGRSGAAAA